jgi:hypothetical protein
MAVALPSCATLTELSIWNNRIGDEGAAAMAAALPDCAALSELKLCHGNRIGGAGGAALVQALVHVDPQRFKSLRKIFAL